MITLLLYIYTRACDSKATTTTTDKKTTIILWGLFKNSNCTHTFHVVGVGVELYLYYYYSQEYHKLLLAGSKG